MTSPDPAIVAGRSAPEFRLAVRRAGRLLWRGKLLVLACLMGVLVPVILTLQQINPRYTAEARVLIEAPESGDPMADRSTYRPRMNDAVVQTEAEVIATNMLARRVVEKLGLESDPEFNATLRTPRPYQNFLFNLNPITWLPRSWVTPSTGDGQKLSADSRAEMGQARIVRAFLGGLEVKVPRRSFIVVIRYTSENREKAARIANAVAEAYLLDRLEAGFEDTRRLTEWLGTRLDSLRRDALAADAAAEEFRSRHNLRRKGERQASVNEQQLSELSSRMILARSDLAQKRARMDQLQRLLRSRGNVDSASDVLQSPLIQRLREQEALRQRELSEALKKYGERHPTITGLRADLDSLRAKLDTEIQRIADSIANDVEATSAGVRTLERELDGLRTQSNVAGEADVRLRELERQAEASRGLYEAFLGRFKREAQQEGVQRANARLVSRAEIPTAASAPPVNAILTMASLLALTIGIGLVFLLDRLDNSLRSADELEDLAGVPTMGMIPLERSKSATPVQELLQNTRSTFANAVRSLRTAIDIGGSDGGARVFVVTSSTPKEGKTFVSTCLGVMFARGEQRVLLVDCDVHRPRLHASLGLPGDQGLAEVLTGAARLDQVVQRDVAPNLDFLPAGSPSEAAELIKLDAMQALLEQLKPHYQRIILDSPPVLAVPDVRLLGQLADRVLYLVKWNATPRDAVRNGMKLLHGAGVKVHGMVLSQVNQRKHGRYGYRDYGQYYGRYQDYYSE